MNRFQMRGRLREAAEEYKQLKKAANKNEVQTSALAIFLQLEQAMGAQATARAQEAQRSEAWARNHAWSVAP